MAAVNKEKIVGGNPITIGEAGRRAAGVDGFARQGFRLKPIILPDQGNRAQEVFSPEISSLPLGWRRVSEAVAKPNPAFKKLFKDLHALTVQRTGSPVTRIHFLPGVHTDQNAFFSESGFVKGYYPQLNINRTDKEHPSITLKINSGDVNLKDAAYKIDKSDDGSTQLHFILPSDDPRKARIIRLGFNPGHFSGDVSTIAGDYPYSLVADRKISEDTHILTEADIVALHISSRLSLKK